MDMEYLEQLAWLQAYYEHLDRFRRGALRFSKIEDCTCPTMWMSILPPPPCPYHGRFDKTTVTCYS